MVCSVLRIIRKPLIVKLLRAKNSKSEQSGTPIKLTNLLSHNVDDGMVTLVLVFTTGSTF